MNLAVGTPAERSIIAEVGSKTSDCQSESKPGAGALQMTPLAQTEKVWIWQ